MNEQWRERMAREDRETRKRKERIEAINRKRAAPHPLYPWLRVDARTQAEIEETREMKRQAPIHRLARKAKKMGREMEVSRDVDGAYRINKLRLAAE